MTAYFCAEVSAKDAHWFRFPRFVLSHVVVCHQVIKLFTIFVSHISMSVSTGITGEGEEVELFKEPYWFDWSYHVGLYFLEDLRGFPLWSSIVYLGDFPHLTSMTDPTLIDIVNKRYVQCFQVLSACRYVEIVTVRGQVGIQVVQTCYLIV